MPPTYAEQVRDVLAVGGDPGFLQPADAKEMWTEDDSAHFGGTWETESTTSGHPTFAEWKREIEGLGGDTGFLNEPTSWDGGIDELAHFDAWEN